MLIFWHYTSYTRCLQDAYALAAEGRTTRYKHLMMLKELNLKPGGLWAVTHKRLHVLHGWFSWYGMVWLEYLFWLSSIRLVCPYTHWLCAYNQFLCIIIKDSTQTCSLTKLFDIFNMNTLWSGIPDSKVSPPLHRKLIVNNNFRLIYNIK